MQKIISEADALRMMLARNFQPSVPFRGVRIPWAGVCLTCGQPGSPRYTDVRNGRGACVYCGGRRVDTAVAEGKMLARDFQPTAPYPGASTPWLGYCLKCGLVSSPRYDIIKGGKGPCGACGKGGFDPSQLGLVYIVTDGEIVKIGITNKPNRRLPDHAKQGLTQVVAVSRYMCGPDARLAETQLKAILAEYPHMAVTRSRLPDGHTEAIYCFPGLVDRLLRVMAEWRTRGHSSSS